MISAKLGLRNLVRNRWRSGLTLAAIAVAVALMVWTLAFYDGWLIQMIRGATAVETAQVQIHTAAYVDKPRVYRTFPVSDSLLATIEAVPEVEAASPRIEAHGLIGNEERSQVARILGVDPRRETATTPVADGLTEGRWLATEPAALPGPREVILGEGVARQLRVGVGAELVVFLEAADGSLGNDLLEVIGIVRTGNTQVDRLTIYMHRADAEFVAALSGEVHEIAIRTVDLSRARETAEAVASAVGALREAPPSAADAPDDRLLVRSWQEILPSIQQMVVLFERSYWIMYLLVYLVAGVGILNTQRMSALERRREFGVMMAIGMRPRRMFRTLQVETVVLGLIGAVLGAALGTAVAWYHTSAGLNLNLFTDQASFSFMGVAFSDRLYFALSVGSVVEPIIVMLAVALACGLWPAMSAARLDPVPTLSGRA